MLTLQENIFLTQQIPHIILTKEEERGETNEDKYARCRASFRRFHRHGIPCPKPDAARLRRDDTARDGQRQRTWVCAQLVGQKLQNGKEEPDRVYHPRYFKPLLVYDHR